MAIGAVLAKRPAQEIDSGRETTLVRLPKTGQRDVLPEIAFKQMIAVERKRTERSANPFLLMLLETGQHHSEQANGQLLGKVSTALLGATRETDVVGWHKHGRCVGVLFTQFLVTSDKKLILSVILSRVGAILRDNLSLEQFSDVSISFHFFPDSWDQDHRHRPSDPTLYPDLPRVDSLSKFFAMSKRIMDIVGSLVLLIAGSPALLIVAVAVKLSSKGPILYRQQRVGQYGKPFMFLKFRSMYVDNDPSAHKDYVLKLIAGTAERHPVNGNRDGDGNDDGVYKLTQDTRITPIGSFLRRSSLDELPQLFNVLRGEMSLVGPRPAIPYEVAAYRTWHRRRVLEVKPGITGLWQVHGRGRVGFDEMVRLDLRYARDWSPFLDLKILLRTPRAVLVGGGAH
jgi:lipopolysaccharide/colanic/teichoic acid biosynthesis glycosyltransferase